MKGDTRIRWSGFAAAGLFPLDWLSATMVAGFLGEIKKANRGGRANQGGFGFEPLSRREPDGLQAHWQPGFPLSEACAIRRHCFLRLSGPSVLAQPVS
jgi:hypothetical protein